MHLSKGNEAMHNSWIPAWVGIAWTVVFVIVLLVHVRHLVSMAGRERLWHGTHVLMSLGMIDMFLPGDRMVVGAGIGQLIFAVAAVAVLILIVADAANGKRVILLWPIAFIDLGSMVYMFAMMSTQYQWLTLLLTAWFVMEAAGWMTGFLAAHGAGDNGKHSCAPAPAPVLVSAGVAADHEPQPAEPNDDAALKESVHGWPTRLTLTLMTLGMAFMFLATQYGMAPMTSMMHGARM